MLPILYPAGTSNTAFFQSNGSGFILHCKQCNVKEVLNGSYELEMHVLVSDRLADSIVPQAYIKVRPNPTDNLQIFEIYEVEKSRGEIVVRAEHIRYRVNGNAFTETWYITDSAQAKTPLQVWSAIQEFLVEESEFTFTSDITTTGKPTAAANHPVRLGDFLLGSEGSMLDTFGGEYVFDNFSIALNQRRGSDTGVCLRLGAGVENATYKVTSDHMYTDLLPCATLEEYDPNGKMIGNLVVFTDSPVPTNNTLLNSTRVLQYDFSAYFSVFYPFFKIECDASGVPLNYVEARNRLIALTQKYISANQSELTQPYVTVNVDIDAETEQLEICKIGDVIRVFVESMNIYVLSKIVSTEYDVLRERFTKIEVGNVPKRVSKYFPNINIGGA